MTKIAHYWHRDAKKTGAEFRQGVIGRVAPPAPRGNLNCFARQPSYCQDPLKVYTSTEILCVSISGRETRTRRVVQAGRLAVVSVRMMVGTVSITWRDCSILTRIPGFPRYLHWAQHNMHCTQLIELQNLVCRPNQGRPDTRTILHSARSYVRFQIGPIAAGQGCTALQ